MKSAEPQRDFILTDDDAKRIRRLFREGSLVIDLASYYNTSKIHIWRVLHNESHQDLDYVDPGKMTRSCAKHLTEEEKASVIELWNKDPVTYTIPKLMAMFVCNYTQIFHLVRFSQT
jgi:hypothetical protein